MLDFLAIIASLILLFGLAMLGFAFIKKKPKKRAVIITVIGFIFAGVVGAFLTATEKETAKKKEVVVDEKFIQKEKEKIEKKKAEDKAAAEEKEKQQKLEEDKKNEELLKKKAEEEAKKEKILAENKKKEEIKQKQQAESKEKEKLTKNEANSQLPIEQKIVKKIKYVDEASISENGVLHMVYREENPLTENTIVNAYSLQMFKAMHEAFKDPAVKEAEASIEATIYEPKGNESVKEVANFLYTRDSFEELNYDKFIETAESEGWRIFNEADLYYMVPVLYNNISDEFKSHLTSGISKFPPVTD